MTDVHTSQPSTISNNQSNICKNQRLATNKINFCVIIIFPTSRYWLKYISLPTLLFWDATLLITLSKLSRINISIFLIEFKQRELHKSGPLLTLDLVRNNKKASSILGHKKIQHNQMNNMIHVMRWARTKTFPNWIHYFLELQIWIKGRRSLDFI